MVKCSDPDINGGSKLSSNVLVHAALISGCRIRILESQCPLVEIYPSASLYNAIAKVRSVDSEMSSQSHHTARFGQDEVIIDTKCKSLL